MTPNYDVQSLLEEMKRELVNSQEVLSVPLAIDEELARIFDRITETTESGFRAFRMRLAESIERADKAVELLREDQQVLVELQNRKWFGRRKRQRVTKSVSSIASATCEVHEEFRVLADLINQIDRFDALTSKVLSENVLQRICIIDHLVARISMLERQISELNQH